MVAGNLGMGSPSTWHGQPDGRIRGFGYEGELDLVSPDNTANQEDSNHDDEPVSDGATSPLDGMPPLNKA